MKNVFLIAVAAATACVSLTATAGAITPAATVRYADLDVSRPADAVVLYRRIERAATKVCVSLETDRTLVGKRQHADCVEAAVAEAVASVDRQALTTHAAERLAQKRRVAKGLAQAG